MATLPFRPLAKLVIIPFSENFVSPVGPPFIAMYNPTTISIQRSQKIIELSNTKDNKTNPTSVAGSENGTFNVELLLDGTSASPPMGIPGNLGAAGSVAVSAVGVEALIELFLTTTLYASKSEHQSKPLKLIWGAGIFLKCRLQTSTINYTLMNRAGLPLRATITATFIESEASRIVSLANLFQSPDITKTFQVKAGDTIYNIAKNEYGDESFYLQIAQANDLKNYRKLTPGQTLVLPPVSKV